MNVKQQVEDLRYSVVKYQSEFQQAIVDWNNIQMYSKGLWHQDIAVVGQFCAELDKTR